MNYFLLSLRLFLLMIKVRLVLACLVITVAECHLCKLHAATLRIQAPSLVNPPLDHSLCKSTTHLMDLKVFGNDPNV